MLISVLKRLHNAFIAITVTLCMVVSQLVIVYSCRIQYMHVYGELVISRHQKNSFQCQVYSVGHLTNLSVNLEVDMNEIFKK